jgi:VIT1/CCC1 family predicted Fe2+/Mn2+ transporter
MQQAITTADWRGMIIVGVILLAIFLIYRALRPEASKAITVIITIGIIVGAILLAVGLILLLFSFF